MAPAEEDDELSPEEVDSAAEEEPVFEAAPGEPEEPEAPEPRAAVKLCKAADKDRSKVGIEYDAAESPEAAVAVAESWPMRDFNHES